MRDVSWMTWKPAVELQVVSQRFSPEAPWKTLGITSFQCGQTGPMPPTPCFFGGSSEGLRDVKKNQVLMHFLKKTKVCVFFFYVQNLCLFVMKKSRELSLQDELTYQRKAELKLAVHCTRRVSITNEIDENHKCLAHCNWSLGAAS